MIKIENVVTPSQEQWEAIVRGMRNPYDSWRKSDSDFDPLVPEVEIGKNDLDLMKRLWKGGTEHRKYLRMITCYFDLTAPLYVLKEVDTYKVGTVSNSCSTMHRITAKEFELNDFSHEHLTSDGMAMLEEIVNCLNSAREIYLNFDNLEYEYTEELETKKDVWWQIIQLLPSSYNQKRTYMMNYEVLANIYRQRKGHRLDEWRTFCSWIESLPYSELITGNFKKEESK